MQDSLPRWYHFGNLLMRTLKKSDIYNLSYSANKNPRICVRYAGFWFIKIPFYPPFYPQQNQKPYGSTWGHTVQKKKQREKQTQNQKKDVEWKQNRKMRIKGRKMRVSWCKMHTKWRKFHSRSACFFCN